MNRNAIPGLEAARLKALSDYEILDTAAEAAFDRLTQLASTFYQSPIALVSLVDKERQWFKSRLGLEALETPRNMAFCSYAIQAEAPFIVPNAQIDDRFKDNPLVTGHPDIRFYAGAPLKSPSGHNIGTLCIIDTVPRPDFSQENAGQLVLLAEIVISEMESRIQAKALERAAFEVERASKARSDFLSLISHEIRTPLTAVVGFTDQLADAGDAAPTDIVKGLQSSSRQLMGLLNDVLDFSKIEAGKIELNPSPIDLAAAVALWSDTWREAATQKGLELLVQVVDDLPRHISIDELRLGQVINNLLSNAVKFTETGIIRLEASSGGDQTVRIEVTDTGIGMSDEHISRLFQPFEQADRSTSRKHGGTGLGMSISFQLIKLMGGGITCHSQLGKGTRFALSLPFEPAAEQIEPQTLSRHVLVVDDIATNRDLVGYMLRKLGHSYDTVTNGVDAVTAARRGGYDIVLMDIRMPGMDGFEAAKRIRTHNPLQLVVALSADDSEQDRSRAQRLGFCGYLRKPLTLDALRQAIKRIYG